ncbi:MAG TPA: hypothetical protein GX506_12425 [Firmicutes bacterium]|nr:hypothetical protein [Bacillota bacterium]
MVVVGASIDMCLASGFLPTPSGLAGQVLVFTLGLVCFGVGAGCYISTEMGAGVRDKFMLGLVTLTKRTIKFIRTILEMSVLIIGWLLGGPIGIGIVITALAIGPIIELTLNIIWGGAKSENLVQVEVGSDRFMAGSQRMPS